MALNKTKYGQRVKVSLTVIPMNGETIGRILKAWEDFEFSDIEIWKPHGWAGAKKYRKASRKKLNSCGRPFRGPVQIQSDGKVIPCCFLTNAEIVLGDTNDCTIEDILKGDAYNELRERHTTGDLKGLVCDKCDQRYVGENPLLYSTIDGNINKTSSTKFNLLEA